MILPVVLFAEYSCVTSTVALSRLVRGLRSALDLCLVGGLLLGSNGLVGTAPKTLLSGPR